VKLPLHLPDVSLVAVTSVAIEATARAVSRCLDEACFGASIWISDQAPPEFISDLVTWHRIDPIISRQAYSNFMLGKLGSYIETSHALCMQWDGYILNAGKWDSAFLEYDYIGAPWQHFHDAHRVGNGGFSLRSRRLLDASARLPLDSSEPEDVQLCRTWRLHLEKDYGIVFAPLSVAERFAHERQRSEWSTFGFHGVFNMVEYISATETVDLLKSLEPSLVSPSERREILAWAFRRRRWRIIWQSFCRMWQSRW
jgi:hypothetical protein